MSNHSEIDELIATKHPLNPNSPDPNGDIDNTSAYQDGSFHGFEDGAYTERAAILKWLEKEMNAKGTTDAAKYVIDGIRVGIKFNEHLR